MRSCNECKHTQITVTVLQSKREDGKKNFSDETINNGREKKMNELMLSIIKCDCQFQWESVKFVNSFRFSFCFLLVFFILGVIAIRTIYIK